MEGYDAIFVFPKLWEKEFNPPTQPPFGLLMCSDLLIKEEGLKVFVYDERLESLGMVNRQDLIKAVKNSDPLMMGISTQSGPMIENGLAVSKWFREECPDAPIVWGGVHPTLLPMQTIAHPLVDVVVNGEGELPILNLARELMKNGIRRNKNLDKVKGIYWKDEQGKVKINEHQEPVPNLDDVNVRWDLVNPKSYIREMDGEKCLSLITSRGCPFRCNFCYNVSFYGARKFRGWSPEKVIEEIKRMVDWGVEYVIFDDDYIFGDPLRMWKILDLRKQNNMDFHWSAPIRGHLLRDNLTKKISDGGCKFVTIGAESGSSRILKLMDKDSDVDAYYMAAKNLKKYDLIAQYSWIFGFPGETIKDMYLTLKTIKDLEEINPKTDHIINIFAPYPGTPSYDMAVQRGFEPPKELEGWTSNFREQCRKLVYVKDKELLEAIRWAGIFRAMKKRSRYYTSWVKPLTKILGTISDLRWKYDFYDFPVEQDAVKMGRRVLNTIMKQRVKVVNADDDTID